MAVKYSFIALLKCVLIKLNLGYKVFILQWVVGGMLFQNVSDMKFSSVGNISLVLIFWFKIHMELENGKDSVHWVVGVVLLTSQLLVSEYHFSKGSHDFDYQMLKLSTKWYHSARPGVFPGSVLCSTALIGIPVSGLV